MSEAGEGRVDTRRVQVSGELAGARIDVALPQLLPELSRSRAAALLLAGHVRVNGAPARKSQRVAAADELEITIPPPAPSPLDPEAIPLTIIYQDADLLVIDKPAGLVVHPAPGHASGTLVNALLHHVPDLAGVGGVLRPGIVHRLDRDTSGLMLVAKHERAHRQLSAALKKREVRRAYLVAAWGHLGEERLRVEAPIARAPSDRKRMAVVEGGRLAATRFARLERWRAADLLRAELETGRTHQIRVHLDHIGHPVVGDPTYGGGSARRISGANRAWAQQLAKRVPRQFLHASELRFRHPLSGADMAFSSELPPELAAAAEWARETSGFLLT